MSNGTQGRPLPHLIETPEEIEFELRNVEASLWTGSRLLIGAVGFMFAALAFAYFYLRSSNSEDLWRPHAVTAPVTLGSAIFAFTVAAAALMALGNRRRRDGADMDWHVAGWSVVLAGVVIIVLQIWELTRVRFYPGSSGYASCFIAWAVMNIGLVLGATYWIETLLARALRLRKAMAEEGVTQGGLPVDRIFHASVEGCTLFWGFTAFIGTLFWVLFYVI